MPIAALLAWAAGFGIAAGRLAQMRLRPVAQWVVFGAVLGPVALGLLWFAPPGRCAVCDSRNDGWLTICHWCGFDVHGFAAPAVRPAEVVAEPASARLDTTLDIGTVPVSAATVDVQPPDVIPAATASADRPSRPMTEDASTNGHHPEVAPVGPAAATVQPEPRPSTPTTPAAPVPTITPAVAEASSAQRILATAVFITGSVALTPGARYTIEVEDDLFLVRGPVDIAPSKVVLTRRLSVMEATAFDNRLVVNERQGSGKAVLAFMSLAGGTPHDIAAEILRLSDHRAAS